MYLKAHLVLSIWALKIIVPPPPFIQSICWWRTTHLSQGSRKVTKWTMGWDCTGCWFVWLVDSFGAETNISTAMGFKSLDEKQCMQSWLPEDERVKIVSTQTESEEFLFYSVSTVIILVIFCHLFECTSQMALKKDSEHIKHYICLTSTC